MVSLLPHFKNHTINELNHPNTPAERAIILNSFNGNVIKLFLFSLRQWRCKHLLWWYYIQSIYENRGKAYSFSCLANISNDFCNIVIDLIHLKYRSRLSMRNYMHLKWCRCASSTVFQYWAIKDFVFLEIYDKFWIIQKLQSVVY